MAASEPGPFSLRLKRVFGVTQFIGDIVEVSIHDLVDNGPFIVVWLGKEERCGVVSTLFGILAKGVRGKTPQDHKVIGPLEFKVIKDLINSRGIPIYLYQAYRYVPPQRVRVLSRFGLKPGR